VFLEYLGYPEFLGFLGCPVRLEVLELHAYHLVPQ
jgi:hypothetical protein